jgi:predicted RNA binding protein YcfA (HicA-like mRNA interferase family)
MPRPVLKVRQVVKRMQDMGVTVKRGKGSELKLARPGFHLYTIKAHGEGDDVYPYVITAAIRRLGLDEEEFWSRI